ncbi:PREDICTED: bifunctional bis(5'-adenosyl)-triphosphatase/adenylylsulfatase FHIT isoform X2 [Camelina sativa]|uniref:Bis(5'-adenosyl)-triphosphatase n=1 Tax=Camelina sativa TaxID=90675 RepID=A0ABM0VAI4_CAMSA|nr:PREDICTED: bifunctional bis(5'-adenosyl)-triphosphatase/adenylylsulfatase FHIT isoform X2 [Camelina sativa]
MISTEVSKGPIQAHKKEKGKVVYCDFNGDGGGAEMLKLQVTGKTILSSIRYRREMSSTCSSYVFGPYKIDPREVFYATPFSYAMVNLRPLLPGHVLVCPRRLVPRFTDLTADETSDLWLTAQKDGPQAGQTVPHVHIHIMPRKGGDFEKNDEVYDALDEKEKELKQKLDLDIERVDRSIQEMADEASQYRSLFDC